MESRYQNVIAPITLDRQPGTIGALEILNLENKIKPKGNLILLIEIESSDRENTEIINILSQELKKQYFSAPTKSTEYAFENSLSKTNLRIKDILLSKPKNWLNKMHVVVIAVNNNEVHISSVGQIHVFLSHKNRIIDVVGGTRQSDTRLTQVHSHNPINPVKMFSNIVSGTISHGQCLVLLNESVLDYISPERIRKISIELDPDQAAKKIEELLSKTPADKKFAAVFIKRSKIMQPAEEAPESINAQSISNNYTEPIRQIKPEQTATLATSFSTARAKEISIKYLEAVLTFILAMISYILEKLQRFIAKSLPIIIALPKIIKGLIRNKESRTYYWHKLRSSLARRQSRLISYYQQLPKNKKIVFVSLAALVLIFVMSVSIRARGNIKQAEKNKYDNLITQITQKIDQAQAALIYNDKARAKTLVNESQDLLADFPQKNDQEKNEHEKLNSLVNSLLNKVENKIIIDNLTVATSVVPAPQQGDNDNLIILNDSVFYLNGRQKNIARLDIKQNLLLSLPLANQGLENFNDSVSLEDNTMALLANNNVGLVNVGSETLTNQKFDYDASRNQIFTGYSGNIYSLYVDKNQLSRFRRAGAGFTSPQNWLAQDYDLKNMLDIAVDGKIYLLAVDGNIHVFFQGKLDQIIKSNLGGPISNQARLYTDFDLDNIYLLDPNNNRLAVLSKKGDLLAQYIANDLANSSSVVVDYNEDFAYILASDKIYQINLSH